MMPIDRIAPMAEMLLERGIPCTIEKPPGADLDEVRTLAATALRTGTHHMVSVNRRFNPSLNRAIDWAHSVGPVRYIRAAMVRSMRDKPDFIWGTGLHAVDAMRHIAGTEVVSYSSQTFDSPEISGQWHIVSFEFAGGVMGRLDILPTGGRTEETYELFGENCSASFSSMFWKGNRIRCQKCGTIEIDELAVDEPHDLASGAFAETSRFIAALRDGTPMAPMLDDVLPSLEICHDIARDK